MQRVVRYGVALGWLLATACTTAPSSAVVSPPPPEVQRATLLFTGDVMQHLPQINAARCGEGFDYRSSFEEVRSWLSEADLTVVNLETTLTDQPPYTGYPMFRAPAALAEVLSDCGVDVACLANNHALDGGARGVQRTTELLDRHGIRHTGLFRDSTARANNHPLLLSCRGIRLALFNYTYGTNGMPVPSGMQISRIDTVQIATDLHSLADSVDCCVVCMHWGNEYERIPNRTQRRLAAFLRRHGADIIIGHHPHVIQPVEGDSSYLCCYSLGNFVSNQRQRYRDGGLMARVVVTRHADGRMHYATELIPVWVEKPHFVIRPLPADDTLRRAEACELFRADTKEHLHMLRYQ